MELVVREAVPVSHDEIATLPTQLGYRPSGTPQERCQVHYRHPSHSGRRAGPGPPPSTSQCLHLCDVIFSPSLGLSLHYLEGHLGLELNRSLQFQLLTLIFKRQIGPLPRTGRRLHGCGYLYTIGA